MHPLRLFIVFFALFFVVRGSQMTALEFFRGAKASAGVRQKIEAKASAEGTTFDAARRHVDVRLAVAFKTSYVFAVVLNGFWLWLLFRKQRQYVAEHVVTALHWACFSALFQNL